MKDQMAKDLPSYDYNQGAYIEPVEEDLFGALNQKQSALSTSEHRI